MRRGEDFGIAMVGAIACETAAAGPDATVGEEEGEGVVVARGDHGGDVAPLAGGGVPDFGGENGAGVVEFEAGSIAADDHDFAIGEDDGVAELAAIFHRLGHGDDGGAGADVDGEGGGGGGAGGGVAGVWGGVGGT